MLIVPIFGIFITVERYALLLLSLNVFDFDVLRLGDVIASEDLIGLVKITVPHLEHWQRSLILVILILRAVNAALVS